MKTTILAAVAAFGFAAGSAYADNFDNVVGSVTAEHGRLSFTVEGSEDGGYTSATLGAEVLSYGISDATTGTLDVYAKHYHTSHELGFGADYTLSYNADPLTVYGVANVEYITAQGDLGDGDFYTAPTLGAAYKFNETVSAYSEVTYTWNASNSFSKEGGAFEVGANVALADNVSLTPAIVRTFDTANDDTQLHVGLAFKF